MPLIVLVGGATGKPESRPSQRGRAPPRHHAGTSTDVVRQTMRVLLARVHPSIHYSSFQAVPPFASPRTRQPTRRCSASSSRRATCSSAETVIGRAIEEGYSRSCSKAVTSFPDPSRPRSEGRPSATACSRSRTTRSTLATSGRATQRRKGCARSRSTGRPAGDQAHPGLPGGSGHQGGGVPVIDNPSVDSAVGGVIDSCADVESATPG